MISIVGDKRHDEERFCVLTVSWSITRGRGPTANHTEAITVFQRLGTLLSAAIDGLARSARGDAGLCCWDYDHLIPPGNVRDDTLLDLYNGAAFAAVRGAMIRRACSDLRPCNTCSRIYGLDDPLQCRWDGGIPSFD